jgi:hypothetical protein
VVGKRKCARYDDLDMLIWLRDHDPPNKEVCEPLLKMALHSCYPKALCSVNSAGFFVKDTTINGKILLPKLFHHGDRTISSSFQANKQET